MDPISRKPNLTPPSVDGTGGASSISGKQAFPLEALQGTAKTEGPAKTGASSPVLESMRTEIANSIAAAPGDRNAALESVVSKRLEAQFGNAVTPQMKQFALDSVKNDPHFSAIFNKLYSEVSANKSND